MRTLRSVARLVVVCTGLGWLSAGCHDVAKDTAPQRDCRIQRVVTTDKTLGGTGTTETVYEYDAVGNLLKKTQTLAYQAVAGGGKNATTTETFAYNADGFLTVYTFLLIDKYIDFTGKVHDYRSGSSRAYTYTDNRVTGYTSKTSGSNPNTTGPQQLTTTGTGSYEYDASGQLVKETTSDGISLTYQNGQLVDYAIQEGATVSHPFTIQNGLIVQTRYLGSMGTTTGPDRPIVLINVNEYDDQRRLIKHQEFKNDTLDSYYTQEWQAGKLATLPALTLPALKGHTVLKSPWGEPGVVTKIRNYYVNHTRADSVYQGSEVNYTNQLNSQGFITNTRAETRYFTNGQTQPDVSTTVYTYSGCN